MAEFLCKYDGKEVIIRAKDEDTVRDRGQDIFAEYDDHGVLIDIPDPGEIDVRQLSAGEAVTWAIDHASGKPSPELIIIDD